MWQVVNHEPNKEEVKRSYSLSYDGKGRLCKVNFFKSVLHSGEEIAYFDDTVPQEIKNIAIDLSLTPRQTDVKIGDWVRSEDGAYARIIKVTKLGTTFMKSLDMEVPTHVYIMTLFGMNSITRKSPVIFLEDRLSLSHLFSSPVGMRALSKPKEVMLAKYVEHDFDALAAHDAVYGQNHGPQSKYHDKGFFKRKIIKVLNTPQGRALFAALLFQKFGKAMTFDEWRQKVIDSVPGAITKNVQWEMWKTLGMLEDEVRPKLLAAEGKAPENPGSGGAFAIPGNGNAKDAEFKDVCKLCNDTKVFKTQDTNGNEVEVPCPICKDKEGLLQKPKVQEEAPKLRV